MTPAPTQQGSIIEYECYLCALEGDKARAECRFSGIPPGHDHASGFPVCEEHVKEPTSVDDRVPAQINPHGVCAACGKTYPDQLCLNTAEWRGKVWILDPMLAQWREGQPSALCPECMVAFYREAVQFLFDNLGESV